MSGIDWALAQQPQSPLALQQANAAQTQNLVQQRTLNALHGYNPSDPDSVGKTVNALTGVGALEQAAAFLKLNATRQFYSALPDFQQEVGGLGGSSDQQQGAGQQPQGGDNSQVATQAQATMQAAGEALARVKAAPPEQRAAVLDQELGQFQAANIDPGALDAVKQHLTDANFSDESIDTLTNHYGAHADNFGQAAAGGGQPPTGLSTHPTGNWATSLLGNPALQSKMQLYKSLLGVDYTPLIDTAEKLAMPGIQAGADIAKAGPIAEAAEAARLKYAPAEAGVEVAKAGATESAKNVADLATLPAVQGAVAKAAAQGAAAGSPIEVTMPNGAPQKGVLNFTLDGRPYFLPIQEAPAAQGGQPGPAIAGPSAAAGPKLAASGQQYAADLAAAAASQPAQVAMRKVVDLLPGTNVGPGVQATNSWRSFILSQLPVLAPLIPGGLTAAKVQTANTNELQKYMVQTAGAAAAPYGAGTNEKLAFATSGNPHLSMDQLSALDVSRMNVALQRANNAKPYLFSTLKEDPGQYSDFASNYARTVDPRAFMLDMLPTADRQKMMATITTPQDKARFLRGVQAAEAAGYFQRADLPR